jgi:hypothetical protein
VPLQHQRVRFVIMAEVLSQATMSSEAVWIEAGRLVRWRLKPARDDGRVATLAVQVNVDISGGPCWG